MSIANNLVQIQDRVAEAAGRAGRSPADVQVVAVSKTVDRDMVEAAYTAGVRHFGENRVQDMRAKFEKPVGPDVSIHLIGQLQTNKARDAVRYCQIVESVDRRDLVDALQRRCELECCSVDILIQVNIAGEEQKAGCDPAELDEIVCHAASQPALNLKGLMTIAPLVDDAEETRSVFRGLREARDQLRERHAGLQLGELSMGMTNDYWVAIEEGATMIRLGRAIFQG